MAIPPINSIRVYKPLPLSLRSVGDTRLHFLYSSYPFISHNTVIHNPTSPVHEWYRSVLGFIAAVPLPAKLTGELPRNAGVLTLQCAGSLPNLPGNPRRNAGVLSLQCAGSLPYLPENFGSTAGLQKTLSKLLTVPKMFNSCVLNFFQKNLKKGLIFSQR